MEFEKQFDEKLESDLAIASYRADQHEENEQVINLGRAIEISSEAISQAIEEERKRIEGIIERQEVLNTNGKYPSDLISKKSLLSSIQSKE